MPEEELPTTSTFENKVILIAILTGFIGSIVLFFLKLPPIVISIFLGTGIAALVYRFLGGIDGASMVMGTIKLSGSIAALLASAYFINGELIKQTATKTDDSESNNMPAEISFTPQRSSWMAIDKTNGSPVDVKINETGKHLPTPSGSALKNNRLVMKKNGNRFLVMPESDSTFYLGNIAISELNEAGFFDNLSKTENFVVTDRLTLMAENTLTPIPFKIKTTGFANDFSQFQLVENGSGDIALESQIYRRSYIIEQVKNKIYLIWVVEVSHKAKDPDDPESFGPYAKFAITELAFSL